MNNPQFKKIDFAVISAVPDEIAYINRVIPDGEAIATPAGDFRVCNFQGKKILISAIGMGTTCAAAMTAFIHTAFSPEYIFFSGMAGSVDPRLNIGDVVIATSAFEAEIQGVFEVMVGTDFESALMHPVKQAPLQESYQMDSDLAGKLTDLTVKDLPSNVKIYKGSVVSTNTFPSPPALFEQIRAKNPLAIDMETSAIYQTAWLLGIKTMVIRGISNILNEQGEDDATHTTDVHGSSENAARTLINVLERLI